MKVRMLLGLFLSISLIAGSVLGVSDASATRYTVAQCGWHVGHEASWYESSASKFQRDAYCVTPAGSDSIGPVFMKSEGRPNAGTVSGTRFARWRWQAPSGTSITAVSGHRWHVLRDNFEHRLGSAVGSDGFVPFASFGSTDTTRHAFSHTFSPPTQAFESRLLCARPESSHCALNPSSSAAVRALILTLDDPANPYTGGDIGQPAGAWLKGGQTIAFLAGDAGSGVASVESVVDFSVVGRTDFPCAAAWVEGVRRGTSMRPCLTSAGGHHGFSTSALSDGVHTFRTCATDFAGNRACSAPTGFLVDNNAPGSPASLTIEGGAEWRSENDFAVRWTNPAQGSAAPIIGAVYRIVGPNGYVSGDKRVYGLGLSRLAGLEVPGSGSWQLRIWLFDAAGNEVPLTFQVARLKLDQVPPEGYLLDPDEADPELFRAAATDEPSGVASGSLYYRMAPGQPGARPGWSRMETSLSGNGLLGPARLAARLDTESLQPGLYEFRATLRDEAGNETVVDERANGSPLVLRLPLKKDSRLTSELAAEGRVGGDLSVAYGSAARITGTVATVEGRPVAGERVTITVEPAPGSDVPARTAEVVTDDRGRFGYDLEPGPSRTVTARFAGTRRYGQSAGRPHQLSVAGEVSLALRPRKVRNRKPIRITGSVGAAGALTSAAGQAVAIQYFERAARAWRPVMVRRTLADGSFAARYRFRYVRRRSRIALRAVLLGSGSFPYLEAASAPVRVTVLPRAPARRRR